MISHQQQSGKRCARRGTPRLVWDFRCVSGFCNLVGACRKVLARERFPCRECTHSIVCTCLLEGLILRFVTGILRRVAPAKQGPQRLSPRTSVYCLPGFWVGVARYGTRSQRQNVDGVDDQLHVRHRISLNTRAARHGAAHCQLPSQISAPSWVRQLHHRSQLASAKGCSS